MEINSEKYWDQRFEKDWESKGGRNQTHYFTNLALKMLPTTLIKILEKERLSFLDWGCAEGDGVDIIAHRFSGFEVSGLDFSKSAIDKAKVNYPEYNFYEGSLQDHGNEFDIIFTSNCLEHYTNPLDWVKQLLSFTKDMLIIMVPFQEQNRIDEHFYTFDYNTFPMKIGSYIISYFKIVDANPQYWPGKQLMIIYSRQDSKILNELNLEIYNPLSKQEEEEQFDYIAKLKEDIKNRDEICIAITKENKNLTKWLDTVKDELRKRDESVEFLKKELQEKDKWIAILQEEVAKRDASVLNLQENMEEKDRWIAILQEEVAKRDQVGLHKKTD